MAHHRLYSWIAFFTKKNTVLFFFLSIFSTFHFWLFVLGTGTDQISGDRTEYTVLYTWRPLECIRICSWRNATRGGGGGKRGDVGSGRLPVGYVSTTGFAIYKVNFVKYYFFTKNKFTFGWEVHCKINPILW